LYVSRSVIGNVCEEFGVTFLAVDIFNLVKKGYGTKLIEFVARKELVMAIDARTFGIIGLIKKPKVKCPFLKFEGEKGVCEIYDIRPTVCKLFPYGRLFMKGKVYALIPVMSICPEEALNAGPERTIAEYWKEQGVDPEKLPIPEELAKLMREKCTKLLEELKEYISGIILPKEFLMLLAMLTGFIRACEESKSFEEAVKKFVNMDAGTILAEGMRILSRMLKE